jgi:alkylation response protein AidB-like acyl-CoA dehydrogenase
VVAAQELGRGAVPVSYHSAHVMAPLLVASAGSEAQQREWLPRIADGSAIVAVALDEDALDGNGVSADGRRRDGDRLSGSAAFVAAAAAADVILVQAAEDLLLVPAGAPGLTIEALRTVDDTRRLGELVFDGFTVGDADRLPGATPAALARALAAGRVALAADALGADQEGLRIAVEYAKQREQFDQVIGSFQAVKHLCAETVAAIDPIQSLLWYTAYAWDRGLDEARHLVPLLKGHATETATEAVTTCTQVFGGIGFTWACDMRLYFKRAGYDRQMLGGPSDMFALAAAIEHPLGVSHPVAG